MVVWAGYRNEHENEHGHGGETRGEWGQRKAEVAAEQEQTLVPVEKPVVGSEWPLPTEIGKGLVVVCENDLVLQEGQVRAVVFEMGVLMLVRVPVLGSEQMEAVSEREIVAAIVVAVVAAAVLEAAVAVVSAIATAIAMIGMEAGTASAMVKVVGRLSLSLLLFSVLSSLKHFLPG